MTCSRIRRILFFHFSKELLPVRAGAEQDALDGSVHRGTQTDGDFAAQMQVSA